MVTLQIEILDITQDFMNSVETKEYRYCGFPSNFLYCVKWQSLFQNKLVSNQLGPLPKDAAITIARHLLEAEGTS